MQVYIDLDRCVVVVDEIFERLHLRLRERGCASVIFEAVVWRLLGKPIREIPVQVNTVLQPSSRQHKYSSEQG
jgi:hypothetical protein